LVKLARQARNRVVEFDWQFSRDDLKRLRRAVYEWGRRISRGRFRSFDARMLAAINGALGDTDSADALTEPMNGQLSGCEISCVGDGGVFRLRGQAPFDVVFG